MGRVVPSPDNCIFALDIGTRTVIGIVALVESGRLRVAAQYAAEHESRSMFDGQIHDIARVADTVLEVKRNLEAKVGFRLTRAAIAAAGRSLVTRQCRVEMEIDGEAEIDAALVNSLETAGVKNAHREVESAGPGSAEKYFCVGYSVVKYYLNNYPITSLIGHRGSLIGADVLATFLPDSVVNGLYSVLRRVGLEPVNLTLEPIAAAEVVIPESLRLLNLALVDIGAGTSDIAISRKGAVVSYGMVPVAGDEITESISEALLVGFDEAEKIKRALEKGGTIGYKDILGVENTITAEEVAALIDPALDRLAAEIAAAIIELNGNEPPRTAFCIGGGSRLPGLTGKLAGKLGIEPQKVAVRGREAVGNLIVDEEGLEGPEGVTVVGIATVAVQRLGQQFIKIKVDGKEFSLFNSGGLSVSSALSMVEFNPRDLIGRNGRNLKFTLNGRPQVVYGGLAKPAEILVNGSRATLKTPIKEGDEITVLRARDGEDARAWVRDFLENPGGISVTLNGEPRVIRPVCILNGAEVPYDSEIKEGDSLDIKTVRTVGDLLEGMDLQDYAIMVNGAAAGPGYELKDGDSVSLFKRSSSGAEEAYRLIAEKKEESDPPGGREWITVRVNGRPVQLEGGREHLFVDIFNHIDFDRTVPRGTLVLKINGAAARYTDVLKDNDDIEIYWEGHDERTD